MNLKLQNILLLMVGLLGLISCSTTYHYGTNNVAERKTLFTNTKYRRDGSKEINYTSFTFGKIVYYEEFHENGQLKTKGRYLKKRKVKGCIEPSKKKGKWKHWSDNGKLTYITIYKKDTLFITEPDEKDTIDYYSVIYKCCYESGPYIIDSFPNVESYSNGQIQWKSEIIKNRYRKYSYRKYTCYDLEGNIRLERYLYRRKSKTIYYFPNGKKRVEKARIPRKRIHMR